MRAILAIIRPELWALVFFSTFINALMLVSPLYMMHLYDKVLTSHSIPTLISLTGIAVALILAMGVLDGIRAKVQIRASAAIENRMVSRLFEEVLSRLVRNPADGSAKAFSDMKDIRGFLTGPALPAFLDAPWGLFFLAVVFVIHPWLGVVALAGMMVLLTLALLSEARTHRAVGEGGAQGFAADTFLNTCLTSAEAVVAMGMLPGLSRNWEGRQGEALSRIHAAAEAGATVMAAGKAARLVLQVVMLAVGGWLALEQEIGAGAMMAASVIMARALSPVEQALGAWRGFIAARSATRRLVGLLAQEPPRAAAHPRPTPDARLTVTRVTAPVPGGTTPFLKDIGLEVAGGGILAVVGPSGAGKSVLGRVLVGLVRPLGGEVRLGGIDLATWPAEDRGRHVGYLPQDLQLVDATVRETITRFTEASEDEIERAARLAGIRDLVMRLPAGYDTRVGTGGVVLSGGQRQRLALARALFRDPPLLVLDEPDASLDRDGEAALRDCLLSLRAEGRAIVVITHRPALVGLADRLVELVDGRVRTAGEREEALASIRARVRGGGQPRLQPVPDAAGAST